MIVHPQPTTTDANTAAGSDELSTQQHQMSEEIARRQRRYLIMMGFCIACFWITIILFLNHLGWFAAIPAVPALLVPFVAVVFINAGHELDNVRGFTGYGPKFTGYGPNLPERHVPPAAEGPGNEQQGARDWPAPGEARRAA